jgi:hypothetical protein
MSVFVALIKFLVNVLETGVAILLLKAYILSMLSCIYLYDSDSVFVLQRKFEMVGAH